MNTRENLEPFFLELRQSGKGRPSPRKGPALKSLMLLVQSVLKDLGTWCGTSTALDFKTVKGRVEHEGLSFLTITLSDFGKDFEKSLDQGQVTHDLFPGFSRSGGFPRFLEGFLGLVFDRRDGRLLDDPDILAIWAIRQFTLMFGKMNIPCSDARNEQALDRYLECEQEVREADERMDVATLASFSRIGSLLWARVFQSVDEDIYYDRLVPRHGPGSTADRLHGNMKWAQKEWTERLEDVFPYGIHLFSSPRTSLDDLDTVTILPAGRERPVKVTLVPKTLKSPRIIAMEPACMQYMQQGVLLSLVKAIRADDLAGSLIGSSSQIPNQELARVGSSEGNLATLDLSEASDRVSNQHVRALLGRHPHLAAGVDASRSRKADVPRRGIHSLAKFASMGSALAFPFESMVFMTIIFVGVERALGRQLTRDDILSLRGKVRCYGDDIIVPVDYVHAVMSELEYFGLKVNSRKSFWTGKFRESCGKEYYDGHDVSIVRLRSELPTSRRDAPAIVSTVSTRNLAYQAGLWSTAAYLDGILRGIIPFPNVLATSPGLGRITFLGYDTEDMCDELHRPLVKAAVVHAPIPSSYLDGDPALLKCLTRFYSKTAGLQTGESYVVPIWEKPTPDTKHLERSGRPRTVHIKTRKVTPF